MKGRNQPNGNKAGRPKVPITKAQLIRMATDVFSQYGYYATTLDQVAARAGIHRTSLLHHFKSKKALYEAVLGEIVTDLNNFISDAGKTDGDFVQALDQLGNRILGYFGRRKGIARLLVRELVDGGPYFEGAGQNSVQKILAVTRDFLQAGMDAGAFRRQDPRHLTFSIIGVHMYYFASLPSTRTFIGKDAYTKKGVELRRQAALSHIRSLCLAEPSCS